MIVHFCNNEVLRIAEEWPLDSGASLYSVWNYSKGETSIFGSGVPRAMAPADARTLLLALTSNTGAGVDAFRFDGIGRFDSRCGELGEACRPVGCGRSHKPPHASRSTARPLAQVPQMQHWPRLSSPARAGSGT